MFLKEFKDLRRKREKLLGLPDQLNYVIPQIDIVADATPKRHYYYASPLGRRLFQFSLGPAALAFIGAGSKDDVLSARRVIDQYGNRWTVEWLRIRGLPDWAEYLEKLYPEPDPPVLAMIGTNGNLSHPNRKLNQAGIRQ